MSIDIPKDELYKLLYARGYRIVIKTVNNAKEVAFTHRYAIDPPKFTISYSLEWTDEQIINDSIEGFLKWSGLRVKYTLDY